MRRSLTLKRETLAELSTEELGAVHGAELPTGETRCPTIPVDYCADRIISLIGHNSGLTCDHTCLCR